MSARAIVLVVLLAAACRHGADDLTGTWTGSFNQIAQDRAGTIRLSLSQSGSSLGGRWEIEIPELRWGGRVEGSVVGTSLDARLVPESSEICPYAWIATVGADRLQGSYEAYDCRVAIVGRIDVRRQ